MESLLLREIKEGEVIKLTAGEGEVAYRYDFEIVTPGEKPQCLITQTNPNGKRVGPSLVRLEGTGRWTNREQNPVQTQERAFTISWGILRTGGLVSVIAMDSEEGPNHRYVFENPPITDIVVEEVA